MNMRKIYFLTILMLAAATYSLSAQIQIIYVAPGATGTGTSWADPKGDVISAVNEAFAASPKKQVWVKSGTYNLTTEIYAYMVNLYGGFAGTETSIAQRVKVANGEPWEYANPTILKGDDDTRIITIRSATVDGFTITNGGGKTAVEGSFFATNNYNGGGVFLTGGTIQNCIIRDNLTGIFTNASGKSYGGGIATNAGNIRSCLIENNINIHSGAGGIYVNTGSAPAVIDNCVIRNNTADPQTTLGGGGIGAYGTKITITNSKVYSNSIVGKVYTQGGGIYAQNTDLTLVNCLFYNNSGISSILVGSNSKLYNNTIVNNTGYTYMYSRTAGQPFNLTNNIIWNNKDQALQPLGLYGESNSDKVELFNNYIDFSQTYPNLASIDSVKTATDTTVTITPHNGNVLLLESIENAPKFVLPSSFIGAGTSGDQLIELQNADFSLLVGSPCIDMGKTIAEVTSDIKGTNRPLGSTYETGAYEFDPNTTSNSETEANKATYKLISYQDGIMIQGLNSIERVSVYSINGMLIYSGPTADNTLIPLQKGFYVFQVGNQRNSKVFVR